jgi:hypothetical protein
MSTAECDTGPTLPGIVQRTRAMRCDEAIARALAALRVTGTAG